MSLDVQFFASENSTSNYLGYGSVKVSGFSINFTVFKSLKTESGIFVAMPSHKKIVDGKEVIKDGKVEYVSEVYIYDREVRHALDEAVKNSLFNQGISYEASRPPEHTFTPDKAPEIKTTQQPTVDEDDDLPF